MSDPLDADTGMRRSEIEQALKITSFETIRVIREEFSESFHGMREGAQASLNTAVLLTGSEEYGITGFIPDTTAWREKVEAGFADDRAFRKMVIAELASIKARQSVIRRCVLKLSAIVKPLVASQWKVLLAVVIAWCVTHLPFSYSIKRFLAWVSSLLTQHAK